jgi:hypothetical protein
LIYITAKTTGDQSSLSRSVNHSSDTKLVFKFDDIDIDDISAITYQLGSVRPFVQKAIGSGVERVDDTYVVSLSSDDLNVKGLLKQYLEITDSTGTYTATLNIGRLKVQ